MNDGDKVGHMYSTVNKVSTYSRQAQHKRVICGSLIPRVQTMELTAEKMEEPMFNAES
jgi:hypothetical protein